MAGLRTRALPRLLLVATLSWAAAPSFVRPAVLTGLAEPKLLPSCAARSGSSVALQAMSQESLPRVDVNFVIDFMCPWSFIAVRSLKLAKQAYADRLKVDVEFVPFEFDPPGTYPPEGQPWREYAQKWGPEKAKFLVEQKLPAAQGYASAVGINASRFMERRLVHTVEINTAMDLAQRHGVGEAFAEEMLSRHFENCENPNDLTQLRASLKALGVPEQDIETALGDPDKVRKNDERTALARRRLRNGVPHVEVYFDGSGDLGPKVLWGQSPTSPNYFDALFRECLSLAKG